MSVYEEHEIADVVVRYFLRSLMRIEREKNGMSQKEAGTAASLSASAWAELERGSRPIKRPHWLAITDALELSAAETAHRLNAFIVKFPIVWVERQESGEHRILERDLTAPRALKSGKTLTASLNQMRPQLYDELASYSLSPDKIIEQAQGHGFYDARTAEERETEVDRQSALLSKQPVGATLRAQLVRVIEELPDEKIGLLERVLDKFARYRSSDLAHAYKHFSLSLKKP